MISKLLNLPLCLALVGMFSLLIAADAHARQDPVLADDSRISDSTPLQEIRSQQKTVENQIRHQLSDLFVERMKLFQLHGSGNSKVKSLDIQMKTLEAQLKVEIEHAAKQLELQQMITRAEEDASESAKLLSKDEIKDEESKRSLRSKLKREVQRAFVLRMQLQKAQLDDAAEKLKASRQRLAQRQSEANLIVDFRVQALLARNKDQRATNTGTVILTALDLDSREPIAGVTFITHNALAEVWDIYIGKSDADGKLRIKSPPSSGYSYSIYPVPEGYQVTGRADVPTNIKPGEITEHHFYLRKLNAEVNVSTVRKLNDGDSDIERNDVIWSKKKRNGLVAGAKLLAATKKFNLGDPVVVQFLLKNESKKEQTIILQKIESTHPVLGSDNLLNLNAMGGSQLYQQTLKPGEVLEAKQYRATVITTGMPMGHYHITAGSAFWIAEKDKPNQALGIPFGRKIPFTLGDPPLVKLKQPPVDDNVETKIYWGKPAGNLMMGMRLPKGRQTWPADEATIEGQLFLFNAGEDDVEVECELPANPADWNLHVTSRDNENLVRLDSVWFTGKEPLQTRTIEIPAGKQVAVTGVKAEFHTGEKVVTELIPGPKIQVLKQKAKFKYGDPKRLINQQGRFELHAALTIRTAAMVDEVVVASAAPVPFSIEADKSPEDSPAESGNDDEARSEN